MTTPTTVNVRLQLRADTAANWTAANPTLLANEVGLETDTKKLKVGNGSSAWNSLAYFPSIVSGGTVLGNLEIGSTGTLTFEGSTADGFETTLAVTNPTADRTITLPNQSGTVVVSGNASIVDADIAANAEIAVSKLADGAARQLLQTDAAGTGVEWTSNVDIPGTLDVTGTATFDGAVTVTGDLTVNGTTTTISTQNLLVEDKNIIIGDVATPTDTTADGGGITLKGATDKTINWVDATDAWTSSERFSVPLGSAASPSLTFTGDENSGVYSPGSDQVAIATAGTGRLFVDASGRVLINGATARTNILTTSTVGFQLEGTSFDTSNIVSIRNSSDTGSANLILGKTRGSTVGSTTVVQSGDQLGVIRFTGSDGTTFLAGSTIQSHADGTMGTGVMPGYLAFSTTSAGAGGPSERLRITSAGLVGVGTSSPTTLLTVQGTTLIRNTERLAFNTYESDTVHAGYIGRNTSTGALEIASQNIGANYPINLITANTSRLHITATGNVGIGTTSPSYLLDVAGNARIGAATGDAVIEIGGGATGNRNAIVDLTGDTTYTDYGLRLRRGDTGANTNSELIHRGTGTLQINAYDVAPIAFLTGNAERGRFDSSGRLLVGTSSAQGNNQLQIQADNVDGGGALFLRLGTDATAINTPGFYLGTLNFGNQQGGVGASIRGESDAAWSGTGSTDNPGRLVFSTTADGASSPTERMRISNNGYVGINGTATRRLEVLETRASEFAAAITNSSATGHSLALVCNSSDTVGKYLDGYSSSASITRIAIFSNGNVVNTNNSYGAISDARLKENITDASSQWDDIKSVQVRNYNLKTDSNHRQIGVVAQEIEQVSPGLVYECPDRDADGNDLGTVTKSVNYSVLYMKAVKALQEAMERIEVLEQRLTDAGIA